MKIFALITPVIRSAAYTAPLMALLLLTSCASTEAVRSPANGLAIETKSSAPGVIVSARAFERRGKLFVAGTWRKTPGYAHHYAAHVDIQLLTKDGTVLASVRDNIEPAPSIRAKVRNSRVSFVGSFPAEIARQADRIRIVAHAHETE